MTDQTWGGSRVTKARAWVIARDHGICAICDHPGANSLEHIIPRAVAPELTWDPTNWAATHLHTAGRDLGCQTPDCGCVGNIARRLTPLDAVRTVVLQQACTCPCTCGARQLLSTAPSPTTHPLATGRRETRQLTTPNQQRLMNEELRYPDPEARRAAAAYRKGDRTEWARVGYNVHLRRQQRTRRGAPPDLSREW